jgi:hypothetical protein
MGITHTNTVRQKQVQKLTMFLKIHIPDLHVLSNLFNYNFDCASHGRYGSLAEAE